MTASADLHVHSRYSDRPGEWFLRRIGAPECFTEPREVYDRCRERGMDFVTISDHNRIDGALEIAHLPGTFVSCEVTTYFPEDGCKIHCLVWGINEAQFAEIQRLRRNIYDLRDYFLDEGVAHAVAHPLFSINDKLTVEHVERLLVLFKRFEAINGTRDPRAGTLLRAILDNLSPAFMEELADRHDLDPRDAEPWSKRLTGGSDDHSGLYIASAHTRTPGATTVKEFLGHLAAGEHEPAGEHGSSLKLARNFYSIAYRYYRDRLGAGGSAVDFFLNLSSSLLDGEIPAGLSRVEQARKIGRRLIRPRKKTMGDIDRAVAEELIELLEITELDHGAPVEERCFEIASRLGQQLSFASLRKAAKYLRKGKLTESLQSLSSLAPVGLSVAPYLAAFHTQHKDEALHKAVAGSFRSARLLRPRSQRRAWFTDTLNDVNGVAVTVETCARLAEAHDRELEVITSLADPPPGLSQLRNFPPVGSFAVPEYESQPLSWPPFLEILEFCERRRIEELIVSTPGPMGLVAITAAHLLGLRLTGIYHTDFPLYVRYLTGSLRLERMTWGYMRWFFRQMHSLYVPSQAYVDKLADNGFDRCRLRLLPRGVDHERFRPDHRDAGFWTSFGVEPDGFTFLYVGRVSKEKNIDALLRAFFAFLEAGHRARLAVVGDGPYLDELRKRYRHPAVLFTGYLHGDELAQAYASSDLFVFPSTTDTLGRVVLEAQASGLPAIVGKLGGAREIVEADGSGLVVDMLRPGELLLAMTELFHDAQERARMSRAALEAARRGGSWEVMLEELWSAAPADDDESLAEFQKIQREEPAFMPELLAS